MEMIDFNGKRTVATYLGDAVYAVYDGYNYLLRLDDHRNEASQICLEPSVLDNLIRFRTDCTKWREKLEDERKESENLASPNNI